MAECLFSDEQEALDGAERLLAANPDWPENAHDGLKALSQSYTSLLR